MIHRTPRSVAAFFVIVAIVHDGLACGGGVVVDADQKNEVVNAGGPAAHGRPAPGEGEPRTPGEQNAANDKPATGKPIDASRADKTVADKKPATEELNLEAVKAPRRVVRQAVPAVPANMPVGVNGVNIDAQVQRLMARSRPSLTAELRIVRQTCDDLPLEFRTKIRAAAEAAVTEVANDKSGRASVSRFAPAIRQSIVKTMREIASEEFLSRYENGLADRAANRKQAAILHLIARVDEDLFLSDEQRTRIADAISAEWDESYEQLRFTSTGPLSPRLATFVVASLNDEQRILWEEMQKNMNGTVFVTEINLGQAPDNDDAWWGIEPVMQNRPVDRNQDVRRVEVSPD